MADISLSTAVDTSGVAAGMASIENTVDRAGRSIASRFSSLFSAGVVIAELRKIADEAQRIHSQSERFGVDAEKLQLIANAAKASGGSLEGVARAMNQLQLNGQKALDVTTKQALALEHLGLSAKAFAAASADEKFLMLADAYKQSAQDGQAYADVAELIGRKNTDLIDVLKEGSQAVIDHGKAFRIMSAEEIKILEALKVEEEKYVASLDGILAKGVVSWGRYFASLKNLFTGNLQGGTGALATTAATALFPQVGLLAPFVVSQTPLMPGVQPSASPSPNARGPGQAAPVGISDLSAGGGGVFGGRGSAIEEATLTRTLNLSARLNELLSQRSELEDKLNDALALGESHAATQYQLQTQIAKIDQQIVPLKERIAQEEQKGINAADQQIEKSQHRQELEELTLQGQTEAASLLQIALGYDEKINAALDKANEARTAGLELTAQENEKLADQLEQEKQLALVAEQIAVLKQVQNDIITSGIKLAEQRGNIDSNTAQLEQQSVSLQYKSIDLSNQINAAYATGNIQLAQALEIQKGITDQLNEQVQNLAYANQLRTQGLTIGQPGTDALGRLAAGGGQLGATSDVYAAALAASRGIQPGTAEYDRLVKQIEAEDQLRILQGKNLDFWTQLNRDKLVQWYAEMQQQKAMLAAQKSLNDQIAYWQALAAGKQPPPGNFFTTFYAPPPPQPTPPVSSSGPALPGGNQVIQGGVPSLLPPGITYTLPTGVSQPNTPPNATPGLTADQGAELIKLTEQIAKNTTLVQV